MPGFPRFFELGGSSINSYKVFLCVGIYVGSLAAAALADRSGLSPLRIGLGAMACALAGLIGARVYHLLVHAPVPSRRVAGQGRSPADLRRRCRSPELQDLPRDDQTLDLGRSFADLRQLGIAEQPLH